MSAIVYVIVPEINMTTTQFTFKTPLHTALMLDIKDVYKYKKMSMIVHVEFFVIFKLLRNIP